MIKERVFFALSLSVICTIMLLYVCVLPQVFLGVDPSVKIAHKILKQQTEVGSDGGAFKSKVPSRLINEQRAMIHNTKSSAAIKLTLVQLLPRSDDVRGKLHSVQSDCL